MKEEGRQKRALSREKKTYVVLLSYSKEDNFNTEDTNKKEGKLEKVAIYTKVCECVWKHTGVNKVSGETSRANICQHFFPETRGK